ncbi:amidase [Nocardioides marmoribigeumensis]|uniref:Asp-tRNA(Asn)/Glu-tRNA(Gln) amidotransferase A subunit family amidase n=1 Tax=Nocardioides marmoribigeumensis TaxID=433649 RepID=A0ABU2BUA7_9ACTN|nr:amidase [Nocardioides marmoribigeumensis]MDR7362205.1 Asp-tRNA(Asn)/Glu-tRNA(Gln) amidotransferase A subunit family amidase [Nocardioides marmoribigeumensis]
MTPEEYLAHDATALAALVADGEVTAVELLDLARRRRDEVNPAINAVVVDLDGVADERAAGPLEGPFAGVPFLVKDLGQEYAGFPTSGGSRALAADVAGRHALVTQRFLDAGLVVFGKTNTPELGAKGVTEPELFGPARNPWDTTRTPGGSSGGSGAAVAAGIVPAAGANDGGGSVRIPAACNGLVGLKLSRGLTPYGPHTGEAMFGMVTQGVVSRTVRDSAGLLDAIVGSHPAEAYLGASHDVPFADRIRERPGRLRIGFTSSSAINDRPDPEAVAAVEGAARLLTELGHEVEEVSPPHDDEALARDFLTIWFAQLHGQVAEAKARLGASDSDFEADTLALAELGRAAGLLPMLRSMANVNDHVHKLAGFHEEYDLLLTPTLAKPPIPVDSTTTPPLLQRASRAIAKVRAGKALQASGVLDQLISQSLGWVPYTQLANLTGRPAISLPLHWTADGLPLGVQLVGALGTDGLLLQLAAQLEEAQPWAGRFPASPV